jgi:hypothetical protein
LESPRSLYAAWAFWRYRDTPVGKEELNRDKGRSFLEEWLKSACVKPERDAVGRLADLLEPEGAITALKRSLSQDRVDIAVNSRDFGLIKRGWTKAPNLLDYLIVEDRPQPVSPAFPKADK